MRAMLQRWIAKMRNALAYLGRTISAFGTQINEVFLGVIKRMVQAFQTLTKWIKNFGDKLRRPVAPKPPGGSKIPVEKPTPLLEPQPVEERFTQPSPQTIGPGAGHGVWIWRMVQAEDGHLQQIIEKAKLAGVDWIAIKAANGTSHWVQFNPEVIRKIQEVGIKVFGWVYAYGNNPQNEAEVAKGVLRLGCDGLIVDAEREYEGKPTAAERYMQLIRAAYPDAFIAYSSFPIISKHPTFPYVEFGKYSNAVLPQCYWKLLRYTPETMIKKLRDEWGTWEGKMNQSGLEESVVPIIPVGQGFAVEAEEVQEFMEAAQGFTGVNLWEWSQISKDVWQVFSK